MRIATVGRILDFFASAIKMHRAGAVLNERVFEQIVHALLSGDFFKDRVINDYYVILPDEAQFMAESMSSTNMHRVMNHLRLKSRTKDWAFKDPEIGGMVYAYWRPHSANKNAIVKLGYVYNPKMTAINAMIIHKHDLQEAISILKQESGMAKRDVEKRRERRQQPSQPPAVSELDLPSEAPTVEETLSVTNSPEYKFLTKKIGADVSADKIEAWLLAHNLSDMLNVDEWKRYSAAVFKTFMECDFNPNGYREGGLWPGRDSPLPPSYTPYIKQTWVTALLEESNRIWSVDELAKHFDIARKELRPILTTIAKDRRFFVGKETVGPAELKSEDTTFNNQLFEKFIPINDIKRYKGSFRKFLDSQYRYSLLATHMIDQRSEHIYKWAFDNKIILDKNFLDTLTPESIETIKNDIERSGQQKSDVSLVRKQEREQHVQQTLMNRLPETNPQLGKSKTTDEAQALMQKEFPFIDWDFKGIHVDICNEMSQTFDELAREHPGAFEHLHYVGSLRDRDKVNELPDTVKKSVQNLRWKPHVMGMATIDRKSVLLSPNKMNDIEAYKKIRKHNAEVGFLVEGNDTSATLIHELGHHVDFWMSANSNIYVCPYFIENQEIEFSLQNLIMLWKRAFANKESMKDVSNYATQDAREAWAESYLAYHTKNSKYMSLPAIQGIGQILAATRKQNLTTHHESIEIAKQQDPTAEMIINKIRNSLSLILK